MKNKMNKKDLNKKGISTVIATVLMIAIVIVIVGIVWISISGLIGQQIESSESCFGNFGKVTLDKRLGKENSVSKLSIADSLSLVRIRSEGLKRIEWRASVEHPNKWGGNKVNIQINTNVPSTTLLEQEAHELVKLIAPNTNKPKGES